MSNKKKLNYEQGKISETLLIILQRSTNNS